MLERRYRRPTKVDLQSPPTDRGPIAVDLGISFLVLGVGVFTAIDLVTHKWWLAALVAGLLVTASFTSIIRHRRDLARRTVHGAEADPVEVIDVEANAALDIEAPGSTGPAVCLDVGNGQILMLYGQWLYDNQIYRAPRPEDDLGDEYWNGLPTPHAFPATAFRLHRWDGSDQPFWIEILGDYLAPTETPIQLRCGSPETLPGPWEIFEGSLDTLQADLDRRFG